MNQDKTKQNYEEYHYTKKEVAKYLFQSTALCGAVDYLFYQNWWCMIAAVPAAVLFLKWKKRQHIRERKRTLNYQFKDALNSLSVAVQAGYSVENAVTACMKDMERLYPPEADIVREFHYIESRKKVSVPVEELFLGLGERSGIEDIENFAAVFSTAKRSGGDMDKIIQTSARMLGDKIDVRKENRDNSFCKKGRTDDHESDACGNYTVSAAYFSGLSGGFVRESLWRVRNDSLPGNLWTFLLAGEKNCGY